MAIHSVCSATAAHWLAPTQTARRTNAGSRSSAPRPRSCSASGSPRFVSRRSGTHSHSTRLTATFAATISRKASRQPHARSNISSGTVTAIAPSAPAENAMPFMVEMRSGGYHSTKAVSEAIRQAETPRPIRARAAIAAAALSANANHAPPAAATSSSAAFTRRGPKRSSATPSGSCTTANDRK